ncbi:MAG: ABC transporter ATP-binding protein [Candidatus Sumerlaeota bacterium]|nr:ABC transporter ATP-binding protein [Candidatus Sumerlaeota bacterium]
MNSVLSFDKISFAYRGATALALDGIDLRIESGQFVGIVGATGAGKSTLVRCASGIVPKFFKGPFRGDVRVDGESLAKKRVSDLTGKVGTVFQDFESQLFSTSARLECAFGMENIGLDRAEMWRRIERVARMTGLEGLMDREPQSLSGGQKQRLALASVLCLEPEILLCDEPTTDLDSAGRADLFEALDGLSHADHAVVLVEHETERLARADRIVVLNQGRIAAQGPPAEVFADPDFCLRNGFQAPQMFALASRLGLAARPLSVEDARPMLERERFAAKSAHEFRDLPTLSGDALIQAHDVHFSYTRGLPALKGVSIEIKEGEFVAILGSNGSGKTTLVKHFNALLKPDAGEVLFDGVPVQKIGIAKMGARVGFVFQNPDHMLFAANVFDEVAFGLKNMNTPAQEIERQVGEALETVGLRGREREDPFIMTKGERQKLAVACVLACKPETIILDEPTTGLDAAEQTAMMELLSRLHRSGHTIIIVTHALDVAAAYARRVVLMSEGRIIADGAARRIFHDAPLMAQAGLVAPPCVQLGSALGIASLTVEELAGALTRKPGAP